MIDPGRVVGYAADAAGGDPACEDVVVRLLIRDSVR
jgi:hypothetical protein